MTKRFRLWLEETTEKVKLTRQQHERAQKVFDILKPIFAGQVQQIKDVAHVSLGDANDDQPKQNGIIETVNKMDRAGIFQKMGAISPELGQRANELRNVLLKQGNNAQIAGTMTVGEFMNRLFDQDNAIEFYSTKAWESSPTKSQAKPVQNKAPNKQALDTPPAGDPPPEQPPMPGMPPMPPPGPDGPLPPPVGSADMPPKAGGMSKPPRPPGGLTMA